MNIRDYIKNKKLLCDGAFGTYFSTFNAGILPEKANTAAPELVLRGHRDYIKAGANLIRTNTFASNKRSLGCTDDELKANIETLKKEIDQMKELLAEAKAMTEE